MTKLNKITSLIKEWCQNDPDDNKTVIAIFAENDEEGNIDTHQTLYGKHTVIVPLLCSIFENDADMYRVFKQAVTIYDEVNSKETETTKKVIS